MPRNYVRKRVPTYSDADLELAISEVQKGKTISEAARQYLIPVETLRRWIVCPPSSKGSGRHTVFNMEEEKCIVQALQSSAQCGFPFDRQDLIKVAQEYVTVNKQVTRESLGIEWARSFEKRWKAELMKRYPELLTKARAADLLSDGQFHAKKCSVECPMKISLRASLDGTALEVYSFIGEHNHEISEEEDMFAEQHAASIEIYNQNLAVRNYLEKLKERFKSEAAEKSNQLAMTESLIKVLKDQIEGFSSRVANYQDDVRQTEDGLIKVHKQLQPEKSLHDELALEIQQLQRRDSTCEDEYNHVVAIRIALNKMFEEYKCDLEEKNKQLAKTDSLMESLNEEIENFDRRKKIFEAGSCRVEEDDLPNKLKVTGNSSREQPTDVNTNPVLKDIMQIAAIKHSMEKVEKERKAKENEEPSSDDDSDNMDNAASLSDSDISDSTNTAVSAESESDTDSEPIAPKPNSSTPIRRAIRPFAVITMPKAGNLASQEPVRIIRRAGSMTYITTKKENERVPEPPSSVPAVMPTMPRPSIPVFNPIPADQCDMCLQVFEDANAVQEHKKNHHTKKETGGYLHLCNMCNFSNTRLCHFKRHLQKHVREKKRRETVYRCPLCPFSNPRESYLKKHMAIHSDERPYACDICHKTFKMRINLETHRISHSDERPFVCKVCCMAFKQKAILKRHHLTKHLGIKRKQYQ